MSNSAFLILDLQNDICSVDGIFHKNGLDANLSLKIVRPIVDMIYFCKKQNIPVIAMQMSILENTNKQAIGLGIYKKMIPFLEKEGLRVGSWGHDLLDEIKNVDYKIKRWTMSAFYYTELARHLAALRVNKLIISGFTTNGIVEMAAREAASRNYPFITLLSDCISSYSEKLHLASLTNLKNFCEVISSKNYQENFEREKF